MVTHGDTSGAAPDGWMSADDIAALTHGRATANTVRSWWRNGALEYVVLPELGTKSNKRSNRQAVLQFLGRKYGQSLMAAPELRATALAPAARGRLAAGGVADLIDTLSSVKAAADATMDALIAEAEANALRSQAMAESDAKRVETLKNLQTMMRAYDLALATHLQPATIGSAGSAT